MDNRNVFPGRMEPEFNLFWRKLKTKPLRVKNKNKHPEKQVIEPAAGMREQRYQWHRHTLNPVQKVHFED